MKIFLIRARDAVYPFTFPKAVQAAVAISSLLVATACGQVAAGSNRASAEVSPRAEKRLFFVDAEVEVFSMRP